MDTWQEAQSITNLELTHADHTSINTYDCRVLSLSDCKYRLNPLSQTRIDQAGRYILTSQPALIK